jgi:hypothetical protein
VVGSYRSARELADRIDAGDDVEPDEVEAALEDLRALHDHLQAGHSAP